MSTAKTKIIKIKGDWQVYGGVSHVRAAGSVFAH